MPLRSENMKKLLLLRAQSWSAAADGKASERQPHLFYRAGEVDDLIAELERPVPMILTCPWCKERHIDEGKFATKPHHTHACQGCGMVWRPAVVCTVGVQFLPGYKNP